MEQLRWEHIELLKTLALLPLLFLIYFINRQWRKRTFAKFGEQALIQKLMPGKPEQKHGFKLILTLLIFALLILSMANPQAGLNRHKAKIKGVDLYLAIDVSKSMLAEDIKPNRLERTRLFAGRLLDKLDQDRIGLIIFAGHAYMQMPLTSDHSAAKMFLKTIGPDMVPTQGTALAEAIDLAQKSFEKGKGKNNAIILISDGEDHDPGTIESAKKAADAGILIETMGVGSNQGAPIPLYQNGILTGYKKDRNGNVVISKLNHEELSQLAAIGGGKYQKLNGSNEQIKAIKNDLATLEQKDIETVQYDSYASYYRIPLFIALIIIILEILISDKKTNAFVNWKIFST